MDNYLSVVKQHVKEDYSVIVIDNSDITKPASKSMEALSLVHDGSTGEIKNGYQTIEAAVLSSAPRKTEMSYTMEKPVISWTWQNYIRETIVWISRAKKGETQI